MVSDAADAQGDGGVGARDKSKGKRQAGLQDWLRAWGVELLARMTIAARMRAISSASLCSSVATFLGPMSVSTQMRSQRLDSFALRSAISLKRMNSRRDDAADPS